MSAITVGLDLGQAQDYTALVVVERVMVLPPGVELADYHRRPHEHTLREEHHVRALRRWELATPYPVVVADVARLMGAEALRDAVLFFDGSGVGRAVRDLLRQAYAEEPFGAFHPIAITATGGIQRNGWHIPKADLLAAVQVQLQQGTLRIADRLPLGDVLERELGGFRQTITSSGRATYDIQRRAGEGHGDLVSALALALISPNWIAHPRVIATESTGRDRP